MADTRKSTIMSYFLFLILSPEGFEKSLPENFEKFEFGKTWAQTEITGEDDLPRIFEFIQDSF